MRISPFLGLSVFVILDTAMGDYGGRWIVLPQKDNGLIVDEETHSKLNK